VSAALMPDGASAAALLPFLMVMLGAILQMTTGVGLGLIAGPFLLFVMDPASAIRTAIVLNLLLSVTLLPWEWRSVEIAPLRRLLGWAAIGIPLGSVFLNAVDAATLKLVSGAAVLAAGLQMVLVRAPSPEGARNGGPLRLGGVVSGLMTGALAIPGPVALWALLSAGLDAHATRATLRAFFVVAYGLALAMQVILIGPDAAARSASMALLPAALGGMLIGGLMRRHVSAARLRRLLEILLFVMGASLVLKGIGVFG